MDIDVELVRPSAEYRDSYLMGLREMQVRSELSAWVCLGDSAAMDYPETDFAAYVQTLLTRETVTPPGFVCDTVYWAVLGREVVGRISIRHELNEFLSRVGGHVGYIVRPSFRKMGIASEMLRLLLKEPVARKIGRILLTCDHSNAGSIKTILKNGGVFEQTLDVGPERPHKNHYWITV